MLGSQNKYFHQDFDVLLENRKHLEYVLKNVWLKSQTSIKAYLEAYDFFMLNPSDYDGATVVNDFYLIKGLDVWAMLHDYIYIKFNVAVSLCYKYLADKFYSLEMRKFHISWGSVWLVRFFGLTLSTIVFTPREYFYNKKRITSEQKTAFKIYINKLNT